VQLGLAETIEALRGELAQAAAAGGAAGFQFPVAGVQLEFHVGVTKTGEGKAGVKFYVVERRCSRSQRTMESRLGSRPDLIRPPAGGDHHIEGSHR
jgi:hypothetical protein